MSCTGARGLAVLDVNDPAAPSVLGESDAAILYAGIYDRGIHDATAVRAVLGHARIAAELGRAEEARRLLHQAGQPRRRRSSPRSLTASSRGWASPERSEVGRGIGGWIDVTKIGGLATLAPPVPEKPPVPAEPPLEVAWSRSAKKSLVV